MCIYTYMYTCIYQQCKPVRGNLNLLCITVFVCIHYYTYVYIHMCIYIYMDTSIYEQCKPARGNSYLLCITVYECILYSICVYIHMCIHIYKDACIYEPVHANVRRLVSALHYSRCVQLSPLVHPSIDIDTYRENSRDAHHLCLLTNLSRPHSRAHTHTTCTHTNALTHQRLSPHMSILPVLLPLFFQSASPAHPPSLHPSTAATHAQASSNGCDKILQHM